jgi:glucans biosynthesis protein C
MFTVGVLAYQRGWLDALTRRAGRWACVAVVAALVILAPLGYAFTSGFSANVAVAAFESVFATGMVVGLLVLFRSRFAGHGPRSDFLSHNAFAVYVLHPLVLTALGYALAGLVAPAIVKALVLGALGLPLCWAFAAAVRALPLARKVF